MLLKPTMREKNLLSRLLVIYITLIYAWTGVHFRDTLKLWSIYKIDILITSMNILPHSKSPGSRPIRLSSVISLGQRKQNPHSWKKKRSFRKTIETQYLCWFYSSNDILVNLERSSRVDRICLLVESPAKASDTAE